MGFRNFGGILFIKPNFGPTETLIISLYFLFYNCPTSSLEGLSQCRVILLVGCGAPCSPRAARISGIFGYSQPPPKPDGTPFGTGGWDIF